MNLIKNICLYSSIFVLGMASPVLLPVVPSNYCANLPDKTNNIFLHAVTEIELGAFDACPFLDTLTIGGNISEIHPEMFRNNTLLADIDFNRAGLKRLNGSLFNGLNKLKTLRLAGNFLTHFPVTQFPVLPSLETLFLYDNSLVDLDVDAMHRKFPSLKILKLADNNIECDLLRNIYQTIMAINVKFNDVPNCLSSEEIGTIYRNTEVYEIRGRVDNKAIGNEMKEVKRASYELADNLTDVEIKCSEAKRNISKVEKNLQGLENCVEELKSIVTSTEEEGKNYGSSESFDVIYYFAVAVTVVLGVVLAVVANFLYKFRLELQILMAQEEDKMQLLPKRKQY